VLASLDEVMVIDAGPCAAGVESTIVAVEAAGWRVLRPGAVAVEALAAVAGEPLTPLAVGESTLSRKGRGVEAPGMLASHYAPVQPVRLEAITAQPHEYHIGFGPVAGDASLSASGDLVEAAARLFDLLHTAQASGRAGIAVAPVPNHGLGLAINDRLARAAAPRG
jgi:L-threonylcarbamoyladenylate synthase